MVLESDRTRNFLKVRSCHGAPLQSVQFTTYHPWQKYNPVSTHPCAFDHPPETTPARPQYAKIREDSVPNLPHRAVTFSNVEAFAKYTAEMEQQGVQYKDTDDPALRTVLYRYTAKSLDVDGGNGSPHHLFEAIHFEQFLPFRYDLRFVQIHINKLDASLKEGDYVKVKDVSRINTIRHEAAVGHRFFPIVWEAADFERMECNWDITHRGLGYVMEKMEEGLIKVVTTLHREPVLVHPSLFSSQLIACPGSVVNVELRVTTSARLYSNVVFPPKKPYTEDDILHMRLMKDTRPSTTDPGHITIARISELSDREQKFLTDRIDAFSKYDDVDPPREMMLMMLHIGSVYRDAAINEAAAEEEERNEVPSIITHVIAKSREWFSNQPNPAHLLDALYSRKIDALPLKFPDLLSYGTLKMIAIEEYLRHKGRDLFVVSSPPGSGKTTLAAVMAAEFMERTGASRDGNEVQLLLGQSNVTVDNLAEALAKLGCDRDAVFNAKAAMALDPHNPATFSIFSHMHEEEMEEWKLRKVPTESQYKFITDEWPSIQRMTYVGDIPAPKTEEVERKIDPFEHALRCAKTTHESSVRPSILLSTIDNCLRMTHSKGNIRRILNRVTRIIVDEASTSTEAALYCLIMLFPQARIVLIGDPLLLPPHIYDENSVGHKLAGRSMMSVAARTSRVLFVTLKQVFRTTQVLASPYNKLSYNGNLVSEKKQEDFPLSKIGLLNTGVPQLLFLTVDGCDAERHKSGSLVNKDEIEAAMKLLMRFNEDTRAQIMVVCMYKAQKNRLDKEMKSARMVNRPLLLTTDTCQGREASVVVVLTTRTANDSEFFSMKQRCTVAISRHKNALVVIGSERLMENSPLWKTILDQGFTCKSWK